MKKKVLIVEDYEDTRGFMKLLVESYGYQVVEAADGQIIHARADAARDQFGDGLQTGREAVVERVFGAVARFDVVVLEGFFEFFKAFFVDNHRFICQNIETIF